MITINSLGHAVKAPEEVKVEPTTDYVWVDTQQYGSCTSSFRLILSPSKLTASARHVNLYALVILKNDKNQDAIDEIESNNEVKVRSPNLQAQSLSLLSAMSDELVLLPSASLRSVPWQTTSV